MRIPAAPTPAPEQAEAVARTRRVLDDARRQGRTPSAVALAHAAYTLACREAGAVDPPPLALWPTPSPRSEPRPAHPQEENEPS